MTKQSFSGLLYLLIAGLTVAGTLLSSQLAFRTACALMIVYLIMELSAVSKIHRIVGGGLILAGLSLALLAGNFPAVLETGLIKTLPFLLLFASIGWFSRVAAVSPSLNALRTFVLGQKPGRRYAAVAGIAHVLGASFNLAGLSLVVPGLRKNMPAKLQRRLGRAMLLGFSSASCWSPFFVGTIFIIQSVPEIEWIDVGPMGIGFAVFMIAWGWCFDRITNRAPETRSGTISPLEGDGLTSLHGRNVLVILSTLFASVFLAVGGMGWSIPVALAIVAPVYSLIWSAIIHRRSGGETALQTAKGVVTQYAGLRGEAVLFTGANLFGAGLTTMLSEGGPGPFQQAASYDASVALAVLLGGYAVASMLGIHPVVTVIFVTSLLTPDMLGLSPQVFALAMMVMWGQGTNASPVSATALYMARATGVEGWIVAWRWNGLFVAITTALLYGALLLLNRF